MQGMHYRLYLIVDIYSRKIVGWEIWETETGFHASTLIKKAVIAEKIKGQPLVLHSDNGSPMKAATFRSLLEKLGITSSFSRPRVSNDNAFSEALFRTCKYRPDFPYQGFSSIAAARAWVKKFVNWYNQKHHHSGLQFVTPGQRHDGSDRNILAQRRAVYERARQRHPERWARHTRHWTLPDTVALNSIKQ
ncbi:transposase InsO family protein [Heliophilum fasciatum]|nr:transposase InsO family protein [Heliophilum fasciatum]